MWTSNKLFALILLAGLPLQSFGQSCNLAISGYVIDVGTTSTLQDALVVIDELNKTAFTDERGRFSFAGLCPGEYHVTVTHMGCDSKRIFVNLQKNVELPIQLQHNSELIREVVIEGEIYRPVSSQSSNTIEKNDITSNTGKNLAQNIDEMAGVSTINNGAGISKPIIQGMWGNRISILNNGIAQSGQQWGVDHAPEIDPFTADHITVVKGSSALAYGGNSLGGVVRVEPAAIAIDPHIHGLINYNFQSNGLGNTLNTQLEQNKKWGAWRLTGTLKLIGDRKSPNYYLTNTGNREANFSAAYQKDFTSRFKTAFYYSLFSTEIGILRGSHISNSTDLESAIGREIPFFTKDHFSYDIVAPRQEVIHQLLKAELKYLLTDEQILAIRYGGQLNNRDEFDARRGGRSDMPALSIEQINHFVEGNYDFKIQDAFLKTGIQYTYVDNTNDNANTGRMPLIPDYRSHNTSVFAIGQLSHKRWFFDFGGRYDYKNLDVLTITQTLPREIERKNHLFQNYSLNAGLLYETGPNVDIKLDVGFVQRQPEVNELYSSGLHQGLASVEYGNPNLQAEQSFKTVLDFDFHIEDRWFIQALAYYHYIQDYIYLMPTGEYEITISGSFPVFVYNQTDAQLIGTDLLVSRSFNPRWKATAIASFLQGDDVSNNEPLIYMPPNNVLLRVSYSFADNQKWRNNTLEIDGKYVAEQKHLNDNQDFLPPPSSYFLLGLQAGTVLNFKHSSLLFNLRIDNALNTVYRDYLNRQRYFADDLGINISLRAGYNF